MKVLHFADLHLDAPFAWAPPAVAAARRQAIRDTLRRICQVAQEGHVDLVTCAGDLYEQDRFVPDTAEFLVTTFGGLHPIPVLLAPGNHDWLAPSSIYATARWSPNVHVFESDHLEPFRLLPDLTIWGAAHRAPANTDDFLKGFHAQSDGVNLGLFHASERSALPLQSPGKEPHAAFSAYEISAARIDHALLGHYHTPVDGDDYTYPGNPEPLSFGETLDRGAVLLEVGDGGSITRERIGVSQAVLAELAVDVSGSASSQEVLDRVEAALAGHRGMARVALRGEVAPALSMDSAVLQLVPTGLDYVLFDVHGLQPAYNLDAIQAERTVRGQFVRDVLEAHLDGDERRRVLITGLRALSGRHDLEVGQ
jgi:exonuclease SbcD